MPSDPFELACLDIAGTTVQEHQAVYVALEEAVRSAGLRPTADQLSGWMGADKQEAIASALTALHGRRPSREEVLDVYADFRTRLLAAYDATPPTPIPGVEAAIATLRSSGLKIALTTGFSREVTDGLLKQIGWTDGVVDAVVCAEEVGAGRPAPYMIFEAMRRTAVTDVRRVIVAGDTARDLRAGRNAGAGMVVGVLTGAQDTIALGREPHTHLLPSVTEIPAALG